MPLRYRRGAVLLEVTVAAALSAVLLLSMASWPPLLRQVANVVHRNSDIVSNAGLAERILRRHIHRAGYAGCLQSKGGRPTLPSIAVYPPHSGTQPREVRRAKSKALPGSQILFVQYARPTPMRIAQTVPLKESGKLQLVLDDSSELRPQAGQELWLTDCRKMVAVRVEWHLQRTLRVTVTEGTLPKNFSPVRGYEFVRKALFIRDSGRKAADDSRIYSLYEQGEAAAASELVPGVDGWALLLSHTGLHAVLQMSSPEAVPGELAGRIRRNYDLWAARYNSWR